MTKKLLAAGASAAAAFAASPVSAHHEGHLLNETVGPLLVVLAILGSLALMVARGLTRSRKRHER